MSDLLGVHLISIVKVRMHHVNDVRLWSSFVAAWGNDKVDIAEGLSGNVPVLNKFSAHDGLLRWLRVAGEWQWKSSLHSPNHLVAAYFRWRFYSLRSSCVEFINFGILNQSERCWNLINLKALWPFRLFSMPCLSPRRGWGF